MNLFTEVTEMQMYSLLDRKLKEFGPPVMSHNDETVRRSLVDAFGGDGAKAHVAGNHPEDFDLFHVGTFDVLTGKLSGEMPVIVANLKEVLDASR